VETDFKAAAECETVDEGEGWLLRLTESTEDVMTEFRDAIGLLAIASTAISVAAVIAASNSFNDCGPKVLGRL